MVAQANFELTRRRARNLRETAVLLRARSAEVRQQTAVMVDGVADGLVTVRRSGRTRGDHGDRFELRLGRVPQAVRVVRSNLRAWLVRNGIAEAVTVDVVLACSEACANAVQHPENLTRQAFEVEARWDGDDLVLSVRDFGRWSTDGVRDETHGRGLQMMRALMDAVDVTLADDGARILMRRKVARS